MTKFILMTLVTLSAAISFASENFYQCTLPQAEEYVVGIDLEIGTAGFFDNETTSIMKLSGKRPSAKNQEIEVLIFTGKDLSGSGDLKLEFNTSTKRIKLSTVETDGTIELLGFANCANGKKPWDFDELSK